MIDAQEFGYDKDRFPKLTDESFDCVICSEVVRIPKECTGCGSLFCAPCINSWLSKKHECPNRCNPSTDAIKPVSKALMRMYNELDVKCKHFDKCGQIIKLVDLEQHEKLCQLPKCENFELCGNLLKDNNSPNAGTCGPECLLIKKLKAADGDWGVVRNELKTFLAPYMSNSNPAPQSMGLSKVNSSTFTPLNMSAMAPQNGQRINFKWDPNRCGTNIAITEDGKDAMLKEAAYIFKTLLGDTGFYNGIHYWEIHADARTENELKIGVSTKENFDFNSAFCDFEYGYAYYGLGQLRHSSNANGNPYGKKFKKEGALGICLDMNKGTLSFALDGSYFGVAFTAEALKKGPIYPAVALLHNAGCRLVTGRPIPQYFGS